MLNSLLHKRPLSEYNLNPLKKGSLRKRPYSHIGYWEGLKGGMSSDAIEGELSHIEANPIFSPSMLATNISFEPILDPDALTPKSRGDPRNPLRHPKHRSHEDYKDDQEGPRQWMEDVKNSCH